MWTVSCPLSQDKLTNMGHLTESSGAAGIRPSMLSGTAKALAIVVNRSLILAQALRNLEIIGAWWPTRAIAPMVLFSFPLYCVVACSTAGFSTAFQGIEPFPWQGKSRINTLCVLLLSSNLWSGWCPFLSAGASIGEMHPRTAVSHRGM